MEEFYLYHNQDFPLIATISDQDIYKNGSHNYSLVHARVASGELIDGSYILYINFDALVELSLREEVLKRMKHKLISFVSENYTNINRFKLDYDSKELYILSTLEKGKPFIIPSLEKLK